MKRRDVLSLLGGAAVSAMSVTGEAEARSRIAVLTLSSPKDEEHFLAAFVQGLRSRGYVEGKNFDIDYRYSNGDVSRLLPLAQELVAFKPDVALGAEPSPAKALKSIAPALPIVCPTLSDAQNTRTRRELRTTWRQRHWYRQRRRRPDGKAHRAGAGVCAKGTAHRLSFQSYRGLHAVLCSER